MVKNYGTAAGKVQNPAALFVQIDYRETSLTGGKERPVNDIHGLLVVFFFYTQDNI